MSCGDRYDHWDFFLAFDISEPQAAEVNRQNRIASSILSKALGLGPILFAEAYSSLGSSRQLSEQFLVLLTTTIYKL